MRTRQTQNNKAYKGRNKQMDKLGITEAVVKVAAKAARMAVQAMAMTSTDNN